MIIKNILFRGNFVFHIHEVIEIKKELGKLMQSLVKATQINICYWAKAMKRCWEPKRLNGYKITLLKSTIFVGGHDFKHLGLGFWNIFKTQTVTRYI